MRISFYKNILLYYDLVEAEDVILSNLLCEFKDIRLDTKSFNPRGDLIHYRLYCDNDDILKFLHYEFSKKVEEVKKLNSLLNDSLYYRERGI